MTRCLVAAAVEKETIDTQKECLGAAEVENAIDTQEEKLSRLTWKRLQREVCLRHRELAVHWMNCGFTDR